MRREWRRSALPSAHPSAACDLACSLASRRGSRVRSPSGPLTSGPGVVRARPLHLLHCVFLAASTVALFRISLSRCRLTLSARRCDRSICSRCAHRGACPVERPCRGRLDSVPYRVFNQPQLLGPHSGCQPIVDSRDRQYLKLGGVFLPRYLHRPPVHSNSDPTISTGRRIFLGSSITVCLWSFLPIDSYKSTRRDRLNLYSFVLTPDEWPTRALNDAATARSKILPQRIIPLLSVKEAFI